MNQYELQNELGETVELFEGESDEGAVEHVHRLYEKKEDRSRLLLLRQIPLDDEEVTAPDAQARAGEKGDLGVDTEATEGDVG